MFSEQTTFSSIDHPSIPDSCPGCGGDDATKEVTGDTSFTVTCDACGEWVSN